MLILRPTAVIELQAQSGRQAHAAVLDLIAAGDPALAAALHADERVKPLTVSPVLGLEPRGARGRATPAGEYGLRVTLLSEPLEQLARAWEAAPPLLSLGGVTWQATRATADSSAHPLAGRLPYDALIAATLRRAGALPGRWALEFATPVTFRRHGISQPLPTPELVFGSLLDKWNTLAPLPLPDEIRAFAAEHIAISGFDMRSATVPIKNGAFQTGAVGRCVYTTTRRDHSWSAAIDLLARFAFYSGVGAGTARGFGQVRLPAIDPARAGVRDRSVNDHLNGSQIASVATL
jgi:CRISPR-associated endoribonuclease Cas6